MVDFRNCVKGRLKPGDLPAIVDKKPDVVCRANESLKPYGMIAAALNAGRIAKHGVAYEIVLCEVKGARSASWKEPDVVRLGAN